MDIVQTGITTITIQEVQCSHRLSAPKALPHDEGVEARVLLTCFDNEDCGFDG